MEEKKGSWKVRQGRERWRLPAPPERSYSNTNVSVGWGEAVSDEGVYSNHCVHDLQKDKNKPPGLFKPGQNMRIVHE